MIELPAQNCAMCHAGPGSAQAMHNGRAIKRHRLALARSPGAGQFERRALRNAEFHQFHLIVNRQVDEIFPLAGRKVFRKHH